MINPSSAPKSPNPMPAGLGALTQMGPTPRGKSPSNMGQVMALARKMSDMQLADVLQGKSLDIPQFAAMTEAMGRKSLRNAMQGAEAQMQAKQPSVKDKLLAEEAAQQLPEASGIGQLPAPNMASMGMAGGGIIAFDDGGEVPRFQNRGAVSLDELTDEEIRELSKPAMFNAGKPFPVVQKLKENKKESEKERQMLDPYGMAANAPKAPPGNPLVSEPAGAEVATPPVALNTPPAPNAAAPNAATRPVAGGGGGGSPVVDPFAGLNFDTSKYDQKYKALFGADPTFTKRDSPYYGMKYEGEDAGKVKEQGIGFGLMKAGQALLKNPTFAGGLGDAIGAFGDQGWLTAKEIKAAKKDERDYNFNMAKATELFEQGESERAIKIQTLAQAKQAKVAELGLSALKNEIEGLSAKDLAKYRKDSLEVQRMQANKPDSSVALLNALKDPANMAIYQQMNTLKKPDMISKETALKEYNDKVAADPRFEKRFPTPQSYYNSLQQNQVTSNPYLAELQRRGLS
jgi:hypothetical protein